MSQNYNIDTIIKYLNNLISVLEKNYDPNITNVQRRNIQDLISLCHFLGNLRLYSEEKEISISAFSVFDVNFRSSYQNGELDQQDFELFYEQLNKFILNFSNEVNAKTAFWLTNSVDKLEIISSLNTNDTKKHLKTAEEIYLKKTEQDRLNEQAQKSEILNKLKEMKNKARCQVRSLTLTIFVLFSFLLLGLYHFNQTPEVFIKYGISNYIIYALIYIPIMSFIWYFFRQRSYAVKIATDYEFKLNSFNLFLYSHNWVNEKIENKEMQDKTYSILVENLLSTLADNPTRLYEKDVKGLPVDEVLSIVKELNKGSK